MKKWAVMGHVVGSKFLGIFEAETKEEAEDMAIESDAASVSLLLISQYLKMIVG